MINTITFSTGSRRVIRISACHWRLPCSYFDCNPSPYLGTLSYNGPSSLHPQCCLSEVDWTLEKVDSKMTALLSYYLINRKDEFRSIRKSKLPRPLVFKSLSHISGHPPIRFDLKVSVAKIRISCNLMRSGKVENQLFKHTWKFWFLGISFTNRIINYSAPTFFSLICLSVECHCSDSIFMQLFLTSFSRVRTLNSLSFTFCSLFFSVLSFSCKYLRSVYLFKVVAEAMRS